MSEEQTRNRRPFSMTADARHWKDIPVKVNENIGGLMLGFQARAIVANNPTPFWWYLPDPDSFIAPFTLNQVISLPTPIDRARILFQSPPQASQPDVVNQTPEQLGSIARFRFISLEWQPQSGVINGATFQTHVGQTRVNLTTNSVDIPLHTFLSPLPDGFDFWVVGDELNVPFNLVDFTMYLELPDRAADAGNLDSGNFQTIFFSNRYNVNNIMPARVSVRIPIPAFSRLYLRGVGFGATPADIVLNY